MEGMITPALARALTKREDGVTVTAAIPNEGEVALVQVGEVACPNCDDEDHLFRRATQAQRRDYGLDPDDGRRAFVCDACGEVVIDDDVAYADCDTVLIGAVPGGEAERDAMHDHEDEMPARARFRIYQLVEADCCGRSAFRAPRDDDAADDRSRRQHAPSCFVPPEPVPEYGIGVEFHDGDTEIPFISADCALVRAVYDAYVHQRGHSTEDVIDIGIIRDEILAKRAEAT